MMEYMPTDMQYKDGLRKDKFLNDLIIESLRRGDIEKAIEYIKRGMRFEKPRNNLYDRFMSA